jgi:S1-C subfamily serine protease
MNRLRLGVFSTVLALLLALPACGGGSSKPADTPEPAQSPVGTAAKTKTSVDSLAESVVMVAPGTLSGGDFEPVATGSGTIVDASGLILTNYHVVDPAGVGAYDDIAIYTADDPKASPRLTYFGGLAAWDEDLDLAVIRITENRNGVEIDPSDLDLTVVEIGKSDALDIGATLTVLGYPTIGGGSLELTKGAVSGFLTAEGRKEAWIKTDARIAAGNSGGGAFNDDGELVGIPTAIYYVEQLGSEGSGRIRPVDLALELVKEAKATTSVVIPQVEQPSAAQDINLPLISASDLGAGFVLTDESSLSNEDRAASYDDPSNALAFYEEFGRVGGVRRVFDDFDSADATGTIPSFIVVQADLYETAEGAAGAADAVSDCEEFLDTMWEFVTLMGFEFHEPQYVDGSQIGEESCLYGAEEDVTSSDEPPLMLSFVGFRQANVLVVVGVLTLSNTYDYQTATLLAATQSNLLAQAGWTTSGAPPTSSRNLPLSRTQNATTSKSTLAAYLASFGLDYAGDCADVVGDPNANAGSYCSTVADDRGDEVIFIGGPTFSEYDSWFLVRRNAAGSWGVADSMDVSYDLSGDIEDPPW